MKTSLEQDVDTVCRLIEKKSKVGSRTMIGIAGPPASGKSTLAEAVVQQLNLNAKDNSTRAAFLPMDGYHLDNRVLETRGLLERKGAPETFDSSGFCYAVRMLANPEFESFHPKFDRQMDLAIANSISIPPDVPIVVVEGNYLLLDSSPWSQLRNLFAATVFVCPSFDALQVRLQQRWLNHGLDLETAVARATRNDLPNAEIVINNSFEADLTLHQNYTEFGVRFAY